MFFLKAKLGMKTLQTSTLEVFNRNIESKNVFASKEGQENPADFNFWTFSINFKNIFGSKNGQENPADFNFGSSQLKN